MTFETWLDARCIDIQSVEPELLRSLQYRFATAQPVALPVAQPVAKPVAQPTTQPAKPFALVVPIDACQWPARAFWLPAVSH